MAYRITITQVAKSQLLDLPVWEQRIISDGVAARLRDQPASPSRAIKRLRPNPLADFELRLGDLRILYKVGVEVEEVLVVLIGRKVGNALIVEGEEFHGHESDPVE